MAAALMLGGVAAAQTATPTPHTIEVSGDGEAQAQANALADALGVKLGPVLKASTVAEVRPIPVMRMQASAMASGGAPTPVEAGQITVPASVSLTYQIP